MSGILYDNGGTDGSNAYSDATQAVFGARRTLLDDFQVPGSSSVAALSWTSIWASGQAPPFGTGAELTLRSDVGGSPGATTSVAVITGYAEAATGNVYFSRPEVASMASFEAVPLAEGAHWIEATVVGQDNNFWLVRSAVTGAECWTNYADFGGLQPGSSIFGTPADLNFQLEGEILSCSPAGCMDTPYDNGAADGSNAYSNATEAVFGARRTLLDDFNLSGFTYLDAVRWTHVWASGHPPPYGTGAEIRFRAPASGAPGTVEAQTAPTGYTEVCTGNVFFSRPEAETTAEFVPVQLPGGSHWIEGTIVGPDNNFWLTKATVTGSECWVDYDDFGGLQPGSALFGAAADLSFCVRGGCSPVLGALSVAQVDFVYDGSEWRFSDTGRLQVDSLALKQVLPYGFLNVATSSGWVVQNLPIVADSTYDTFVTFFDIGPLAFDHEELTEKLVAASYTRDPLSDYSATEFCAIPVEHVEHGAEGGGSDATEKPLPPPPGGLKFPDGARAKTTLILTPAFPNVQCAQNQCVPMAVSNCFQWLEDKYGIDIPNDHAKGLRLDTPNTTLVGLLESQDYMNRGVTSRKNGQTTNKAQRSKGIEKYIATAKLMRVVTLSGPKFEAGKDRSRRIRFFLIEGLQNGLALVLDLTFKANTAFIGHQVAVVGYGKVGKPDDPDHDRLWIAFVHDEKQSDLDPRDSEGTTDAAGKPMVTVSYVKKDLHSYDILECYPRKPSITGVAGLRKWSEGSDKK